MLETFATLGIDPESGLDQKQIAAMCYLGQVGQASARSIALALGVDESAYQHIEEWLVRRGFIVITSRGRVLTQTGAAMIRRDDPV